MQSAPNHVLPLALHLGAWGVMVVFFLGVLATQMEVIEVLALVFGNFGLLALLFYSHAWLVNRYWEKGQFGAFFPIAILIFAFVSTCRYFINVLFLKKYLIREGVLVFTPEQRLIVFVLITSFIFAVVGVVFQLIVNRYRRERLTMAMEAEQRAAELQFLKAQINPHFLFNALHNLYSLTVTKSDLAPKMLLKLSGLLRYAIYDSRQSEVSLSREVAEIKEFIELFSMRSSKPPDIRLEVVGDISRFSIEPMLLIPIVENCFKHTDFDTNPAAYCRILLEATSSESLQFSTLNTFDPNNQQKDNVGGVGLDNMERRLLLRYPERHQFKYGAEGNLFHLDLNIMYHDL